MSTSLDFSAEQLAAARATAWHQDGRALETLESARNWVDHYGFVLYAPKASQLGAPAPSFIETTLGAVNEGPTAAAGATARSLVARLVAEGSVVPLNLLGTPGDLPDFLVSAKAFPYIFTMRGDKAWKQAPQTTGATKVSPLALSVYEALKEKGAQSAGELVSELGREVTEAAILRALNELWAQLRVIPQLQIDESSPTLWELLSARFAKAIKAGANAGQPSAMSALLSLYLSQAVAATEEEVAGFLSPLTARSRVREVVHALTAARQLETSVVDGKTLLHVAGDLPAFPAVAKPEGETAEAEAPVKAPKVGTGRIAKFEGGAERKPRTDFKGKPAGRTFAANRGSSSEPRPSRPAGARPDTERRPFKRTGEGLTGKPSFTKPWDEDRKPRQSSAEGDAAPSERKPYERKPYERKTFGAKKSFGDRPKPFGERKSFGDKPKAFGARKSFGDKPSFGDRPARPRREGGAEGFAPRERSTYPKREGASAPRSYERRPYAPREGGGDRPPRSFDKPRSFFGGASGGADKPRSFSAGAERSGGFAKFRKPEVGERKPYVKRTSDGDAARPARSFSKPAFDRPSRPRGDGESRPSFDRAKKPGGFGSKPSFGAKPSFGPKKFGAGAKPAFGGPKKFGTKPAFGSRPASKFGAKPAGKFGAKPARAYAKRADGAAPVARKRKSAAEE